MGTKLFVAGLPFSTTSDELAAHFSQAGTVVSANVISDKYTGKSRGFGFVEMGSEAEAQAAVDKFNNSDLGGRTLVVNEARPMEPRSAGGGGGFGGGRGGGGGFGGGRPQRGGFERRGDRDRGHGGHGGGY